MNINRILLTGNLTADPELAQAGKTKVARVSLANHEIYTDSADERQQATNFFELKIWGESAENFVKCARQGSEIFVEGNLRQDRWEDAKGGKRSKIYVRVISWQFTQRRKENGGDGSASPARQPRPVRQTSH
jgi:single-strand DNA-binding protein